MCYKETRAQEKNVMTYKSSKFNKYPKTKWFSYQFVSRMNTSSETSNRTNAKGGREKLNQCDYASVKAGHLRTHLKTHSGEKSHKCNQCDYASVQSGNLRTHLKTHSGEKSYKCNQCDHAFTQASSLRAHFKTHSL